jgi:hypothetical protein
MELMEMQKSHKMLKSVTRQAGLGFAVFFPPNPLTPLQLCWAKELERSWYLPAFLLYAHTIAYSTTSEGALDAKPAVVKGGKMLVKCHEKGLKNLGSLPMTLNRRMEFQNVG